VTGFSRNLEYETLREFDRWPPAIVIQGRSHNIRILKAQLPVIEQHFNTRVMNPLSMNLRRPVVIRKNRRSPVSSTGH
jgi:hypothetical protein